MDYLKMFETFSRLTEAFEGNQFMPAPSPKGIQSDVTLKDQRKRKARNKQARKSRHTNRSILHNRVCLTSGR